MLPLNLVVSEVQCVGGGPPSPPLASSVGVARGCVVGDLVPLVASDYKRKYFSNATRAQIPPAQARV